MWSKRNVIIWNYSTEESGNKYTLTQNINLPLFMPVLEIVRMLSDSHIYICISKYINTYINTKYIHLIYTNRPLPYTSPPPPPPPPLHIDNMYFSFKVFMLFCSRWTIISHFFLNFLMYLTGFRSRKKIFSK